MPVAAITVENLAKSYLVGHRAERGGIHSYTALRDVLGRELRGALRKTADVVRRRHIVAGEAVEEFWALKELNFEVREGEVLGIIGRNGAGKSTLLKILSRITEPTRGRVTLRGRVASLLEVGTGFHPELTGRENIYLNGAILGMSRAEIRKKFDEIVAFAEVERFLDTPVKRYSSGMYVRLAFAVAAHLEPDILVVDEVLAVGDAEFQKKCLGKMDEVSRREGRTVLFVSHNMTAISDLARRALFIDHGSIAFDGSVPEAVAAYLSRTYDSRPYVSPHGPEHQSPYIRRAELVTSSPNATQVFGEPMTVKVWVQHTNPLIRGHLGIQLINQSQVPVAAVYAYPPDHPIGRKPGETFVEFNIPAVKLNIGKFGLRIWLSEAPGREVYEIVDACSFEVVRNGFIPWWRPESSVYHEEFTVELREDINDVGIERRLSPIEAAAGS